MSSRAKADWIVAYDGTTVHGKPPYTFECRRCGVTLSIQIPPGGGIPINDYVATGRAFQRTHKRCRPKGDTCNPLSAGAPGGTPIAPPEK